MVSFRYFSGVAVTLPETEPVSAAAAAPSQSSNNAAATKRFLIGMHDMVILLQNAKAANSWSDSNSRPTEVLVLVGAGAAIPPTAPQPAGRWPLADSRSPVRP